MTQTEEAIIFLEHQVKQDIEDTYVMTREEKLKFVDMAINALKGGWIPTSERLPDESGKYLVTVKNLTGHWIIEDTVFECEWYGGSWIFQGWEDNHVIAWMPKPVPYEEN